MRNTYLFCDKCELGHIHKLPSGGGILSNQWSWDKWAYIEHNEVLCKSCASKKRKK